MRKTEVAALCRKHMHRYVGVRMTDGSMADGIVEHVDEEFLYLAIPVGDIAAVQTRAFVPCGYPYPIYAYPHNGFPGYFPGRRFRRFVVPLAALLALSLLPYY